jgi:PAS domain S-box-containing protein
LAKGLFAAVVLCRVLRDPGRLSSFRDLGWFALVAVLIVPAAGALAGAGLWHALGANFWPTWSQWFMGDALAHIVLTPAILTVIFYSVPTIERRPGFARALEIAVILGGLAGASYLGFHVTGSRLPSFGPLFYAPIPFLYWAAIRFQMAGASFAVLIFALCSVNAAAGGAGPFASYPPAQMTLFLQNFLVFRLLPVYLIGMLVEQQKNTERSLVESELRFRTMANSAPVLIWMSGLDKLCTFFNQGWLAFTGRPIEAEIGNGWVEGVHPDDVRECFESYSSAFDARRPFGIEYRLRRHDGEYRWIMDVGVPRYGSNGEFCGYIGSMIDITDRRQAEETRRHLGHLQRLASIGELSATIAHEVRQPLNAIKLHAKTVERLLRSRDAPFDEIGEIVADIEKDVSRADDVVDRIRGFVRGREPGMSVVDVNAVVTEVARLVSDEARRRRVEIELAPADGILRAVGDRTQIMQVLLNLVLNGVESMEGAAAAPCRLTLRTERRGGFVELSVADRGRGISPEAMPRLFESFFTTRSDGMGLGLSIAKSIIEAHGGRIWAENNAEGGATFYVSLPVLDA